MKEEKELENQGKAGRTLSCKKSLAHVHEVKGQNICNVYVSPVLFKHLWKIVGLSVLGAFFKKALMQQLISQLTLNL